MVGVGAFCFICANDVRATSVEAQKQSSYKPLARILGEIQNFYRDAKGQVCFARGEPVLGDGGGAAGHFSGMGAGSARDRQRRRDCRIDHVSGPGNYCWRGIGSPLGASGKFIQGAAGWLCHECPDCFGSGTDRTLDRAPGVIRHWHERGRFYRSHQRHLAAPRAPGDR